MITPLPDEGAHAGQVIRITRVRAEHARHRVDRVWVELDHFDVSRPALKGFENVAAAAAADDAGALRRGHRIRRADDVVQEGVGVRLSCLVREDRRAGAAILIEPQMSVHRSAAIAEAHAPAQKLRVHLIKDRDARRRGPSLIERRSLLDIETGVPKAVRPSPEDRDHQQRGVDQREEVPARSGGDRRQDRQQPQRGDHAGRRQAMQEGNGEQRPGRGAREIGGVHPGDLLTARPEQEQADGGAEGEHRQEDDGDPEGKVPAPRGAQVHDRKHCAGEGRRTHVQRDE